MPQVGNRPADMGFPRFCAAASLKRVVRDDDEPPGAVGFPRFCAAASLKHDTVRPREACVADGFPRFCAAASLKQVAGLELGRGRLGFSAVLCRGLIEAILTMPDRQAPFRVFRGFVPRPH